MGSNRMPMRVTQVNRLGIRSRRLSAARPRRNGPVPVWAGMRPSIIHVREGEDIKTKILAFSQGRRALGIISGIGSVSAANLKIPGSDATVTYERPMELLSLRGFYTNFGEAGSTGGVAVTLFDAEGHIRTGIVEGVLTAGGPVQVVVLST